MGAVPLFPCFQDWVWGCLLPPARLCCGGGEGSRDKAESQKQLFPKWAEAIPSIGTGTCPMGDSEGLDPVPRDQGSAVGGGEDRREKGRRPGDRREEGRPGLSCGWVGDRREKGQRPGDRREQGRRPGLSCGGWREGGRERIGGRSWETGDCGVRDTEGHSRAQITAQAQQPHCPPPRRP